MNLALLFEHTIYRSDFSNLHLRELTENFSILQIEKSLHQKYSQFNFHETSS